MVDRRYGVDLITMFHPSFWDRTDEAALVAWCAEHPGLLWERIVETLTAAAVTDIELTFPPLGHATALAAFGSASAARNALAANGLRIVSGFHLAGHWDQVSAARAYDGLAPYAEFLAEVGAETVVLGLPETRRRRLDDPAEVERAAVVDRLAATVDAVALRCADLGVRVAVHTEAHSVTVRAQDLRRFLDRTDPTRVGVCPDAAHLTLMGEDPVAVVREFADRVFMAHWKDAIGAFPDDLVAGPDIHETHRLFMCPMGMGVVDWHGWAAALARTPIAGVRLLELDATLDPLGELIAARTFAESLG